MSDWRTIDTLHREEVVLCGWWVNMPDLGCWWEMDIDIPGDHVTHWKPLEEIEGPLPPRPRMPEAVDG